MTNSATPAHSLAKKSIRSAPVGSDRVWFATILALVLPLVGVLLTNAAYARGITSAMTAVDRGCPEATAAGQMAYGCTDLIGNLQSARLWLKQNPPPSQPAKAGGVDFTRPVQVDMVNDTTFKQQYPALPMVVQKSLAEVAKTPDEKNAFAGGADQVPPTTIPPSPSPSANSGSGNAADNGSGNGAGNGPDNGVGKTQTGTLPVTGVSLTTLPAIGIMLLLVGVLILRFTRRRRR